MEKVRKNLLVATLLSCSLGIFSVVSRIEILILIGLLSFLALDNLNTIKAISLIMLGKVWKLVVQIFFPFLNGKTYYGFDSAEDLVEFLENGAYDGRVQIDANEVKRIVHNNKNDEKILLPMVINHKPKKDKPVEEKPKGPRIKATKVSVKSSDDVDTIETIKEDQSQGVGGG